MKRYFENCNSLDDVKALYRQLAKDNHPDKGGNTATMQEINKQYAFICAKIAKEGFKKDGTRRTAAEAEAEILKAEAYKDAINKVINLEGITIEIVGAWIWITGETKQYHKYLNAEPSKFTYAKKRDDVSAWFFRTEEYKSRNKSYIPLDAIRDKYGSKTINKETENKLN